MFVELVELLRCPRAHEASPLVASASRTEHRHIIDGVLGCPVCRAEFVIRDGIVRMGEAPPAPPVPASVEEAVRICAFLELTDARGFALLCGTWAAHAGGVRESSETPLVLVNPPLGATTDTAAVVVTPDALPFAEASARAAAIDATLPAPLRESVARTVRAGGRVIGTIDVPPPGTVTEIARDERVWVGTKSAAPDAAPRLVALTRGRT